MKGGCDKKGKVGVPEAAHVSRIVIRDEPVLHSHDAHLRASKCNQGAGAVILGKYDAAPKGWAWPLDSSAAEI